MTAVRCLALTVGVWLAACASTPDHFYMLNTLSVTAPSPTAPIVHLRLRVTIPSLVDRAEMVINTAPNAIVILDHERWGAPLADQVQQTLSRDLEAHRGDVLVGDRGFDQGSAPSGSKTVTVKVDIVRMSVERSTRAAVEARWRISDANGADDKLGSGTFDAAVGTADYAAVAHAYSDALGALAARVAEDLPRR